MKYRLKCKYIMASAFLLTSIYSHAACTTIGSSGVVGFNLAVASNFYLSAQSIAANFLAVGPKNYDIHICEGSSGSLYTAISSGNTPQYALFLSADQTRPANLAGSFSAPFTYAKGTPAFLLSPAAYSSGTYAANDYLITGITAGSPRGATASPAPGSSLSFSNYVKIKASGSPSVTNLAIATPSLAPYGEQSARILGRDYPNPTDNMGQWSTPYNAGTNITTACSTLGSGAWMCQYDNINITLDAINANKVTAGFVSYGQVCPALTGSTYALNRYVLFPDYPTIQDGILLDIADGNAENRAASFVTYMLDGAGSSDWNTWLTSHCYQGL